MNQIIPSQSRQGALSKSWCRFTKAGLLAAVLAGAAVPVAQADTVHVYGTLTIQPLGILDIQENNFIVKVGIGGVPTGPVVNIAPGFPVVLYTGIQGYVQRGLYTGPNTFWDGNGINSSTAAAEINNAVQTTGIGVIDNADAGFNIFPYAGNDVMGAQIPKPNSVAVSGVAIVGMYTYFGDSDLDGVVGNADQGLFNAAAQALNDPLVPDLFGWLNADYDYDGIGGGAADQGLFNAGLQNQGPPLVSQGGFASVPEPTGVALVSVGILGLLAKRRKHQD